MLFIENKIENRKDKKGEKFTFLTIISEATTYGRDLFRL